MKQEKSHTKSNSTDLHNKYYGLAACYNIISAYKSFKHFFFLRRGFQNGIFLFPHLSYYHITFLCNLSGSFFIYKYTKSKRLLGYLLRNLRLNFLLVVENSFPEIKIVPFPRARSSKGELRIRFFSKFEFKKKKNILFCNQL